MRTALINGIFACSGILVNHEFPRQGMEFVTRKVSDGLARVHDGPATKLVSMMVETDGAW